MNKTLSGCWVTAYEERSSWAPNPKRGHDRLREWSLTRASHYEVFKSQFKSEHPTQTFFGVRHAFLPDKPLRKSTWQAKFKRDFRKLVVTRAGRLWNESGRKESFNWFVSELTYPSYSYKKRLLLLVVKLSFYIFINNINSRQITDFHYYWKLFKIVSELVSTGSLKFSVSSKHFLLFAKPWLQLLRTK